MEKYRNVIQLHQWLIELESVGKNVAQAVSEHVVDFRNLIAEEKQVKRKAKSVFKLRILPAKKKSSYSKIKAALLR